MELSDNASFLISTRPLELDAKAKTLLDADARAMLSRLGPILAGLDVWSRGGLEAAVTGFAEDEERKLGRIAQPLRAALTGRVVSPGIFDVLAVLGREESLARLADQGV